MVPSALSCRFIHSFYRYLLNASFVLGSVLGPGDITVNIRGRKKKRKKKTKRSLLSKHSKFKWRKFTSTN